MPREGAEVNGKWSLLARASPFHSIGALPRRGRASIAPEGQHASDDTSEGQDMRRARLRRQAHGSRALQQALFALDQAPPEPRSHGPGWVSVVAPVGDDVSAGLPMWTIYANPSDYAGKYVVRRSVSGAEGVAHDPEPLAVVDTLMDARRALPRGLVCMHRAADDDPVIVEVWL